MRTMELDGCRVTMQVEADLMALVFAVRIFCRAPQPGPVASVMLTYPMRSLESAQRFVSGADEATFRRALEQLRAENEVVAMLNAGLLLAEAGAVKRGDRCQRKN